MRVAIQNFSKNAVISTVSGFRTTKFLACNFIFAFGSAFFWSILLMTPVFLDFIMMYSDGEGFLPAFYVSFAGWGSLSLLIGFPMRTFLLIRREKRAGAETGGR